jgi:two-component system response regulator YesN
MHYSEPISLALVVEKVCVSPSYPSNIFHEKVGESYIKFLTRVRMKQAAKLLESKPLLKVYRVSEKVGYINVKHFSYIFKNYFSQTPS